MERIFDSGELQRAQRAAGLGDLMSARLVVRFLASGPVELQNVDSDPNDTACRLEARCSGFQATPVAKHTKRLALMAKYVPSPRDWVREQVELYESSGGTRGTTLRETGLPVIIVTHLGNKTGVIRKTPLMRVKDGDSYVLVGSQGGAPKDPVWVYNLRANPHVELRDETVVRPMQVREVKDKEERNRLWTLAVAAYPPYADYQARTTRQIPVFVAEP